MKAENGAKVKEKKTNSSGFNGGKLARTLGVATVIGGATVTAATLGVANYLVEQITRPQPVNFLDSYTFSPFELQVDHERVSFQTAGDTTLEGWLFPRPGERKVVLAVSGY